MWLSKGTSIVTTLVKVQSLTQGLFHATGMTKKKKKERKKEKKKTLDSLTDKKKF